MSRHLGSAPGPHPGRDLDRLLGGGSAVGLGDGALLARVARGASPAAEAAFETLVRRHGALVARVCRGILGDSQHAEDAAQAVFLVLLRRARSIGDPDRLAPWLHGVALRTARAARRQHRRHGLNPIPPDDPTMISTMPDPAQAALARERTEILHAAIDRLPHRYRDPVVLCDLEGLTHAEAAGRLNCPAATVSIRLKRARERLRAGLARHRIAFESALPLPPAAVGSLARLSVASASAQALASRVLGTAAVAQWKAIVAAALVAGVAGVGAVGAQPGRQDPPAGQGGGTNLPAVAPQDPPAPAAIKADPPRRGALRIAKLRHAGDWDIAPQAIPHLAAALRERLKLSLQVNYRELAATDADLVHYPLVYLQGHAAFSFGAEDLDALRRHLVDGSGTLFADAAGGSPAFDAYFRRFAADFLPAAKLEPILPGDALYSDEMSSFGFDLANTRRTTAAGGAAGYPDLEGVKVAGRWAVIYSRLDIGRALAGQVDAECRGYTPEGATKIATNVVIYSILPVNPQPPTGIKVGRPMVHDVTDYEQYAGRVAASRTVEVRSRVDGIVHDVKVVEGDLVQAGQALLEIEREDRSGQPVGNDELRGQMEDARNRVLKLRADARVGNDPAVFLAQEKYQSLKGELDQLLAKGRVVVAPFAGRVARRLVDVGATVETGKTPLATIVAVDPILVDFEMDERTFLKIRRWLMTKPGTTHLPVRVALTDEEGFPHAGRVLVQTGRFNPETGTCTLHAELPNADHALIPGLYARVQVETSEAHRAFLVPEAAVETEQGKKSLRVVDAAGVVQRRPIEVGMLSDGLRAVREGVDAETRVILDLHTAPAVGSKVAAQGDAPPR